MFMRADEVENMKKAIAEGLGRPLPGGGAQRPTVPTMDAVREALAEGKPVSFGFPPEQDDLAIAQEELLLALARENRQLCENLTSVQARCTQLLEENRKMRRSLRSEAAVALVWNQSEGADAGKLLAIRDERVPRWGLPGGRVELGESLREALDRELHEELGLPVGTVLTSRCVHSRYGDTDRERMVYLFDVHLDPRLEPLAVEDGTSLQWLTPRTFLQVAPAGTYYPDAFRRLRLVE